MKDIVSNADQAIDDEIGALAEEFNARLRRGEKPTAQEYADKYPHLEELILGVFPALEIMGATVNNQGFSDATVGEKPGVLGDYQIIREAGRGGMGVVYEAQQISLDRRVALKVLPFAAVLDERQIRRFHNEARAAAQLKHPNIVQVYGVGCERSVHFYAMEFVKGGTLESVIDSMRTARAAESPEVSDKEADRALATTVVFEAEPEERDESANQGKTTEETDPDLSNGVSSETTNFFRGVARIGADIADALDHAHVEGVVHRDIKPSNLMLDASGKIWITDFGLARIESSAGVTMTGDLLGTMRYMSPEQALAHRVVIDHRTDVYSLGVTLYELIALRPAFPQLQQHELLKSIAFEGPPRLKRVNPRVPQDLATILGKAIERNPSDRYATAKALADDLRRFLDQRPIKARPPRVVDVISKWAQRHWKPLATCLAAILLAIVTGVAMLERNRGWLAEANSSLAAANKELEEINKKQLELAHYTTGQYLLEKGDLSSAYREIRKAVGIADHWEYGHLLAKICESRRWLPVARIAVGQSPDWTRIVSRDARGLDEYVVFQIGSRLEVHSIRDKRMVQQMDLAQENGSPTSDVLFTPPSPIGSVTEWPRLVHLDQSGKLTFFSLPNLARIAPSYRPTELEHVAGSDERQRSVARMATDSGGTRLAIRAGRRAIVLDISDPAAVSLIESFEAKQEVVFIRLSPNGTQLLYSTKVGRTQKAYLRALQDPQQSERELNWSSASFLDENTLIGVSHNVSGGVGTNLIISDLRSKQQRHVPIEGEALLNLGESTFRRIDFQVLKERFRRTELSKHILLVTEGEIDLNSGQTTEVIRATNVFPTAEPAAQLLYVEPTTKSLICIAGSELVVLRAPRVPVSLSKQTIESIRWNAHQHGGELFVHTAGENGEQEEFALYDVQRPLVSENSSSRPGATSFRLSKPKARGKDSVVTPMAVTMNTTPGGDRLAVLWGEVDTIASSGTTHRLEAYVYDKAQVIDAVDEVAPIVRVPLPVSGTLGTREVREFALTPSGNTILLCTKRGLEAYNIADGAVRYRTQDLFPHRHTFGFAIAPHQSLAATGDPFVKRTVQVWDIERGALRLETNRQGLMNSMAFDMEAKHLTIGWRDGSLDVYRLSDRQLVQRLPSAPSPKAISPIDDRWIGLRKRAHVLCTRELVDSKTGATISGMVLQQYAHILNKSWYSPDGRVVTSVTKYKVSFFQSLSLDSANRFLSETFPLEITLPADE